MSVGRRYEGFLFWVEGVLLQNLMFAGQIVQYSNLILNFMSELCPICCKNNIPDDPEESIINVRVYAHKGSGTTVHSKYFDIPTYACVDCHQKITDSESTERLLFMLAAGLFAYPALVALSGDRELMSLNVGLMFLAAVLLIFLLDYKAARRVKIHPDSALQSMSNVNLFHDGKQMAKIMVRSDKSEFWWLFM